MLAVGRKANKGNRPRTRSRVLVAAVLLGVMALGCQSAQRRTTLDDPALTALGQASIKITEEKMKSLEGTNFQLGPAGPAEPAGQAGQAGQGQKSGLYGPLNQTYILTATFEGPASEAVAAIAQVLKFGFVVGNAKAGRLPVVIEPANYDRTLFWLISDLNKRLAKENAFIGVDSVNKRLILTASEDD